MKQGGTALVAGTALIALSLALASAASGAPTTQQKPKAKPASPAFVVGGFTPAVADPRLAAVFAGRGLGDSSFRFTPSPTENRTKAVKVAVRARSVTPAEARHAPGDTSVVTASAVTALTPVAYNLGVAVGWKRFALSGDVAKIDTGVMPGSREAAEVGVSYSVRKFTGRVQVGAERNNDNRQLRLVAPENSYSLDVGGSYSLARNLALTGGVRYRIDRDRLQPVADDRRDSQAVYVGTAFRF